MSEQETKPRRTKTGLVVSDKMDKTVVVAVGHLRRHRLYGRHVRTTRRFKAHDETNECRIGDSVIIEEARPMSHDKRWRVQRVLRSSFVADLDSLKGASDELPEPAETTDAAETPEEAAT